MRSTPSVDVRHQFFTNTQPMDRLSHPPTFPFHDQGKADGTSIPYKVSIAAASLILALAPEHHAMASNQERFMIAAADSSSSLLERYGELKSSVNAPKLLSAPPAAATAAGEAADPSVAAIAAGVAVVGGLLGWVINQQQQKVKQGDSLRDDPAPAPRASVLPRENAVLVLGATGRVGRRVVNKVRGGATGGQQGEERFYSIAMEWTDRVGLVSQLPDWRHSLLDSEPLTTTAPIYALAHHVGPYGHRCGQVQGTGRGGLWRHWAQGGDTTGQSLDTVGDIK